MNDSNNTIAGWALFAGIIGLGAWIVTGEVFHPEKPEHGGYKIQGVVEDTAGGAAAADKPLEFYLSAADPAKGEQVFKKCAACHNAEKGGANGLGPNLWGVVGEAIGKGVGGYAFSPALSGKGGNWDFANLNEWLTSPAKFAPGTKMSFTGLPDPQDRANVIGYLNQHGDAPKPLPAAPAAAPAAAGKAAAEAADADAQKAGNQPVLNEQQAAPGGPKNIGGEGAAKQTGPNPTVKKK